jgi:oligopeptidase B
MTGKGRIHYLAAILLVWTAILFLAGCGSDKPIDPPVAKVIPKADTLFGDVRVDNYYWLRDKTNPEVIDYIKAENAYTEAMMKSTKGLQDKLYKEMVGRLQESDTTAPVKNGDYYYYSRTEKGQQYPIYCRKKGNLSVKEEVLIDLNTIAEGHKYLDLGTARISPDQQYYAYTIDTTGSEDYSVLVKDLNTGKVFDDVVSKACANIEWANDNRTFFYITMDETMRPYRLYKHSLGSDYRNDPCLFEEKDLAFYLNLSKSRSMEYILINLESNSTNEIWYINANDIESKLKLFFARKSQVKYYIDFQPDQFYILTNENAPNYKVEWARFADGGAIIRSELIPEKRQSIIEGMSAFEQYLVLHERIYGVPQVHIIEGFYERSIYVHFPEQSYSIWPTENPDYKSTKYRFNYSSMIMPATVFDYDMKYDTLRVIKQRFVPGYDPKKYQSQRFFVKNGDSVFIPVTLVYKQSSFKKDGRNPALLEAYGAYGIATDAEFSSARLSLLDRGFVYVMAQIRGGNEMGRSWYDQGRLLNKKHSFEDLIAVGDHLIRGKYTSKDNLIVTGASAGGLLMGVVANMRPDLFKAIVAEVPFVDALNTMLDASLPLTVTEYEEWGNPTEKAYYDYIKSYSPYDNVENKAYPNILITGGLNDPRVGFWEPTKWAAKLRAMKTDKNLLLLKINMGEGHFGVSGRYDELKEQAFIYAFMLKVTGKD